MKIIMRFICVFIVLSLFCSRDASLAFRKVHVSIVTLPDLPKIDIKDSDRFLNDLMLCPLWKVEKDHNGSFIATARSIGQEWPSDMEDLFLFELMSKKSVNLPKGYCVHSSYFNGSKTFSSFRVAVTFKKPDFKQVTLGKSGTQIKLGVYELCDSIISLNSSSDLAIKISSQNDIYVILNEQGADPDRKTTISKVLPAMQELARLAESPKTYRVEEQYAAFFKLLFSLPLQDIEFKRFPSFQARDAFYGYFRTKPGTSYNGINIKISHPVFCPDEGTNMHYRLEKAEYSGKPYQENDVVFFLIEDNAVYLSGEYDQRFGIFTGTESFDGIVEVLNDQEKVLFKTTEKFKGWQR